MRYAFPKNARMNYFKLIGLIFTLVFVSCEGKKVIQLPKANFSVVTTVQDHSPIYLFFNQKGKDTLVALNRKNAISSTHWIFSIDKRLPLRLVIPEMQFLQAKKAASAHKSETAQNYFAYANDSLKSLAFTPFTHTTYQLVNKPILPVNQLVWITKSGELHWQGKLVTDKQLELECQSKPIQIQLAFDGSMSFETYLATKIKLERVLASKLFTTEWVVIGGDRVRSLK